VVSKAEPFVGRIADMTAKNNDCELSQSDNACKIMGEESTRVDRVRRRKRIVQRVSVLSDNHREWYQQRWGLRGLIVRLLLLLLQQYVGVVV
jgi:hypothetical protein